MKLNTFNIKLKEKKKRLGRGIGSSKGKTSGRGHKGQKSRSGVAIKSFEGGQMPLYRRLPKRGFNNKKKINLAILNLHDLQRLISKKLFTISDEINLSQLKKKKILKNNIAKIKILGKGDITGKISVNVDFISNSAKKKIEDKGGLVKLINK